MEHVQDLLGFHFLLFNAVEVHSFKSNDYSIFIFHM